jgi:hypothetical protein
VSHCEVTWDSLDWAALDRLRDLFLAGGPRRGSYWTSLSDLANYDFTFGQRIGWKWDAVLRELRQRGWSPPKAALLDWGCGSGIAGRRVIEFFGADSFQALRVFDRSALAMDFALSAARRAFPELPAEPAEPAWLAEAPSVGVLVVSHVLNELTDAEKRSLRQIMERANALLWVEPGTHETNREMLAWREELLKRFLAIAPCTHQASCGLLAPGHERHWCHHFAAPPPNIMADANWVRFAQRAGIDLRSLPYSFLALERKGLRAPTHGLLAPGCSRVIGAPRFYKGFAKVFSCQEEGVRELTVQKRDAPELFKQLALAGEAPAYRWRLSGDRILSGERLAAAGLKGKNLIEV